jgi:hypothetical protein
VRADDVASVEECREDDNDCVATDADAGVVPPARPLDVGPALRVRDHGDPRAPDVAATLDWSLDANGPRPLGTAPGEQHYHVMRGVLGSGAPVLARIPASEPVVTTALVDVTPRTPEAQLPHAFGYVVVAADWCEEESAE